MPEIVVISGCASGIGRALALDLSRRTDKHGNKSYKVYATDFRPELLEELAVEGLETACIDVTDSSSVTTAVDDILAREGHIDICVANAGIMTSGWLAEIPMPDLIQTFDVNVFGAMRLAQAVAPGMMDRRKGKIATVCSVVSWLATGFGGPYSASKAALAQMTETLRIELEPFGVQVTSIIPGWVRTGILVNNPTDYKLYLSPASRYFPIMKNLAQLATKLHSTGITAEAAAQQIANGLTRQKAPRFLYTRGGGSLMYLFGGFLQTWVAGGLIAKLLRKLVGLKKSMLDEVYAAAKEKEREKYLAAQEEKPLPQALMKEE